MSSIFFQSKRNIFIVLIVTLLVVFDGIGGFFLYRRSRVSPSPTAAPAQLPFTTKTTADMPANYPQDVFSYDITQTPASFIVVGVNTDSLRLQFILPFKISDNIVTTRLTACPYFSVSTVPKNIKPNQTIQVQPVHMTPKEVLSLVTTGDSISGICSDQYCSSLISECSLSHKEK